MPQPPKPIEVRPGQGGKLMTGVSAEACGIANWTIKRDWRRYLDQEIRSEGYDLFAPNLAAPDQPPTTDPITLIAEFQRPNGAKAVVVATQTTIWRYFGLDDTLYETPGYVAPGYSVSTQPTWVQIGGGYSTSGRRWEAESLNGYLILNNGVDLPVTYRVEEMAVSPIYELRENGIASVGTLTVDHSILMCGDIVQIKQDKMQSLLGNNINIIFGVSLETGQHTAIITGLCPGVTYTYHADGNSTVFVAEGTYIQFFGIINNATVSVTCDPYQALTDSGLVERFQWRTLWSLPNLPRRFGAVLTCSTTAASLVVTMGFAAKSLIPGQAVTIIGAGLGGNNLSTTVLWVDGTSVRIADLPSLTVANTSMFFNDADPTSTITGKFYDLQGDGTAILKMKSLRDLLVVYKEASIFLAQYTADINTPWIFTQQDIEPEMALFHRDTLVSLSGAGHLDNGYAIGGAAHIYAGKSQFYRFDLTNRVPMEMPELRECQDLFFSAASAGQVFASLNPITKEVLFCFPYGPGPDYAIRFDYRFGTASTTSMKITAGQAIIRPEPTVVFQGDMWYVMGTLGGQLLRYGLIGGQLLRYGLIPLMSMNPGAITVTKNGTVVTSSAPIFTNRMVGCSIAVPGIGWFAITGYISATQLIVLGGGDFATAQPFTVEPVIYHRNGQAYDSVLQSGLDAFGSQENEKVWERYTPILASRTLTGGPPVQTPVAIAFRTANNPSAGQDTLAKTIQKPLTQNMVTLTAMAAYFGDRITVSGMNNPVGIVARILEISPTRTRGFVRRQ